MYYQIKISQMLHSAVKFRQNKPFAVGEFVKQGFVWYEHRQLRFKVVI